VARKYLQSLHNRAASWKRCRAIFVGQEDVGKTTLISCLQSSKNKVSCDVNISTDGIRIQSDIKIVPDDTAQSSLSLVAWDLGGQEVFYPTHNFFLTSSSIYVVVFNLHRYDSSRVDYWMRSIRMLSGNSSRAPVVVVGTHADHPDCPPERVESLLNQLRQVYSPSRFRGLHAILGVSCKTGLGINEFKQALLRASHHLDYLYKPVPISWVQLYDCVTSRASAIASWQRYVSWAHACSIDTKQELQNVTGFLRNIGALIHFGDPTSSGGGGGGSSSSSANLTSSLLEAAGIATEDEELSERINLSGDDPTTPALDEFESGSPLSSSPALSSTRPLSSVSFTRKRSLGKPNSTPLSSSAGASWSSPGSSSGSSGSSSPSPLASVTLSSTSAATLSSVGGVGINSMSSSTGGSGNLNACESEARELRLVSCLSDLVVLQPQWLADLMASLITFSHSWIRCGILEMHLLPLVFANYTESVLDTLLALLEKFQIVFRMKDSALGIGRVLVPGMLPETRPDDLSTHWPPTPGRDASEYGREYVFPFLPLGFFPSFVCTSMHLAEVRPVLFWRSGLLLRTIEGQAALVLFDPENYSLSIRVRLPNVLAARSRAIPPDRLLLNLLVDVVEYQIESKFKFDHVDRFVPCTHCLSSSDASMSAKPFFFSFSECTMAALSGQEFLFCQHIRSAARCVLLAALAPDVAFHGIPSSFRIITSEADLQPPAVGQPAYNLIRLNQVVGKGGFGLVYRGVIEAPHATAEQPGLLEGGTEVAVKELNLGEELTAEQRFLEFQKEVFIMRCVYLLATLLLSVIVRSFARSLVRSLVGWLTQPLVGRV